MRTSDCQPPVKNDSDSLRKPAAHDDYQASKTHSIPNLGFRV